MSCKLCNSSEFRYRDGEVRDNKELKILECEGCGLVFLSNFDHIDDTFYKESKMHEKIDFEKWQNDTEVDDTRRFEFVKTVTMNKSVLDFGSGNGNFLYKIKNIASEVCGVELEKNVKPFYEKNSIKLYENLEQIDKKFDFITSFHVLEHLQEPIDMLKEMSLFLKDEGKIIIEVPNSEDALLTLYKSESFSKFTYWSCHLYLYNQHTLSLLAEKAGLKIESIEHIQRYPISNHLYWLSHNKPGGHIKWGDFLDSDELKKAYQTQLASIGATDTIIALLSKNI